MAELHPAADAEDRTWAGTLAVAGLNPPQTRSCPWAELMCQAAAPCFENLFHVGLAPQNPSFCKLI